MVYGVGHPLKAGQLGHSFFVIPSRESLIAQSRFARGNDKKRSPALSGWPTECDARLAIGYY